MFTNYTDLEEFVMLNQHGERRNCEFKSGLAWDDGEMKYKITKAILSMSNLRDGGYVIVGIDKRDNLSGYQMTGMSQNLANTYNAEKVLEFVNTYARSHTSIELKPFSNADKHFIVIQVSEFSDIPIICNKNYDNLLHEGRIYGRPHNRVESSDNLTAEDMAEIFDLALEKRLRKQLNLLERLGITPRFLPSEKTDDEKFAIERADF